MLLYKKCYIFKETNTYSLKIEKHLLEENMRSLRGTECTEAKFLKNYKCLGFNKKVLLLAKSPSHQAMSLKMSTHFFKESFQTPTSASTN